MKITLTKFTTDSIIKKIPKLFFGERKSCIMKKILKVLSVGLLSAAVALSASSVAFAAGINEAEQKILDELHTTVTMNGVEKTLPADYINQAENYFNTVDITEEEANQVISGIEDAKTYLTSTGASSFSALSTEQVDTFVSKCQSAVAPVNLTLSYTKSNKNVSIVDSNGSTVFTATVSSVTGGNSGTNTSNDPIKTTGTGFNIPGVMVVAGVGILLVSAAGIYLFKSSKKETLSDVKA